MPITNIHFPALDQFKTIPSTQDPYFIIDHPITGNAVKILLSDLQPYITAEMVESLTLTQLSDVPAYTNSSYLTINSSGAPAFVLLNTTAKAFTTIDLSANPNFPAAAIGDRFRVSVRGKIGGASGMLLEVDEWFECTTASSGGTFAFESAKFKFFPRVVNATKSLTFVNSPYSVENVFTNFVADATSGVISFILPAANTVRAGTSVTVIKIDAANNVNVTVSGGATINGSATQSLTTQWETMRFIAMGGTNIAASAWYKV